MCHFASRNAKRYTKQRAYKSVTVMCRRAIGLALEHFGCQGRTLGPLLVDARKKKLLSVRVDALAEGIKDFGDGGAHRVGDLEADGTAQVIYNARLALNELFDPQGPAMQSMTSSNAS